MSDAVFKYKEDFGRSGSLTRIFVADEARVQAAIQQGVEVLLGDVLGNQAKVVANLDGTTVTLESRDPAHVTFVRDLLRGDEVSGTITDALMEEALANEAALSRDAYLEGGE